MAIFDPIEQRMCVRIVYDGTAGTGKTTNLRMLCGLFATQRKTELYSPGEVDGRTLYFDWVQILAGSVCGYPLMCQVISVPGQAVLTPRRRHLLEEADVVIFVCDSTSGGFERAREALRVVDGLRERNVPLVVQANKQDQPGAISGSLVLERLELRGVPVVEAIASEGIGVVDTFVNAVRLVSREMQSISDRSALKLEVRRAPGADAVLRTLHHEVLDPEWAAEMCLEEAQTAMLLEARVIEPAPETERPLRDRPPLPTADVPTGFIWPAHTGRNTLRFLAEKGAFHETIDLRSDGRVVHTVLGHALRTSRELHFHHREDARQALVRAAREHTQLGALLAPDTVLLAQPSSDDTWWIWSIMPELTTVSDALGQGADRTLLDAYAVAVVDALRASLRHGFSVDLAPTSFGVEHGIVRYAGEVRSTAPTEESLRASLEEAVTLAPATILDAFGRELHRRLNPDEVARTRLEEILARGGARSRGDERSPLEWGPE